MAETAHPVVLTVPRGALSLSAMRLVVGWVASCNDLPLDQIDDVNLAIETLVAGEPQEGEPLMLTLSTREGLLQLRLEGLSSQELRANLAAADAFSPSVAWPLDVRIFLSALVDEYAMVSCGVESFGVSMSKRIS